MFRRVRLHLCLRNAVVPVTVHADLSWNALVHCSPPELSNHAVGVAAAIASGHTSLSESLRWAQLFLSRGIRHEGVVASAVWKVFKAPLPLATTSSTTAGESYEETVAAVATAFRITITEGFVSDPQLLAVAVSKCIECAPVMSPAQVGEVMLGIAKIDRANLTAAESSHQLATASATLGGDPLPLEDVTMQDSAMQVNLLDVLSEAIEGRIVETAQHFQQEHILASLEGLLAAGVCRWETVGALGARSSSLRWSLSQLTQLLSVTLRLHTRVIDVLSHVNDVNPAELRSLCTPLLDALAQHLSHLRVQKVAKEAPQLILALRQLCEVAHDVGGPVPVLWEKVRCVRIAHHHTRSATKSGRPVMSGKLDELPRATRPKRRDFDDPAFAHRYIPPQFKHWRGRVRPTGHQRACPVRSVRFGVRKIPRGYVGKLRRKFRCS